MNVYVFRKSNKVRGIDNVTVMTQVIGFEELLSAMSNQDPRLSFMMESAWGIPLLLTCLLAFA